MDQIKDLFKYFINLDLSFDFNNIFIMDLFSFNLYIIINSSKPFLINNSNSYYHISMVIIMLHKFNLQLVIHDFIIVLDFN